MGNINYSGTFDSQGSYSPPFSGNYYTGSYSVGSASAFKTVPNFWGGLPAFGYGYSPAYWDHQTHYFYFHVGDLVPDYNTETYTVSARGGCQQCDFQKSMVKSNLLYIEQVNFEIRLAITSFNDVFGTGHQALEYLKEECVTRLKSELNELHHVIDYTYQESHRLKLESKLNL